MIEQLARTSAAELRNGTSLDIGAGLADLHVREADHRRKARFAAGAAVVLAVGLGAVGGTVLTDDNRPPTPATPLPTHPSKDPACERERTQCLGDRTYRYDLARPVVWSLPSEFAADSGPGVEPYKVEVASYRQGQSPSGVTVLERVRPSSPDGQTPAAGVADDPQSFVDWVASRPYLDAGPVTRTTLDGHPAWQVRVTPAHAASVRSSACDAGPCHLITYQPDGSTTGIWGTMTAEYIALRLPGGGTTVVWSWRITPDPQDVEALNEAVQGLSWPAD
jgi:hypothetical protein